ncbi:MAG: hypothetical protein U5J99_13255 [Parvularculaceae bacterium]|nr:hypothetical protein [Parvularculaceae bacterium]
MPSLFFTALGILALAGFVYWRWSVKTRAEIEESAGLTWTRLVQQKSDLVEGIDESHFRAAFFRTHFPRFPKYALAAVTAFIVALPVTFYLLGAIAWGMGSLGISPDAERLARAVPVEGAERLLNRDDGETVAMLWINDVLSIGYYFGLLFVWMAIVAVAMRRYHTRRPGYIEEELANERAKRATS